MGFATALAAIGTGISAIGAISAGNAAASQAEYAAQVAKNNQTIAAQNANYAAAAGETKAYNEGLRERQAAGRIRAAIAASGIDVNSGSAAKVQESQAGLGLQDIETVRQNAALQTYGFRTQQQNFAAQSQLDSAQADYDREAGWLKGTAGLLSGTAKFGGDISGLFSSSPGMTDTDMQKYGITSGPANPFFVSG